MLVNDIMNTKEKIFDVSVDLFSQYGYDGVSVRQIAGEVGIKESSIYNHYKSKESIMDSILEYYICKMTQDEIPLSKADENLENGIDYFYNAGLELYISKLSDAKMMKITRILLVESYHNEKIRNFVKKSIVENAINGWTDLFELMKSKNMIKEYDSKQLAESFYYYGLFLLFEHFIVNYPEEDDEFLKDLAIKSRRHMKLIYNSVEMKK